MAVRQFNNGHTGDVLTGTIPSGLDAAGVVTWAFVIKRDDVTNWSCLVNAQTTAPADAYTIELTAGSFGNANAMRAAWVSSGGSTTSADYSTWADAVADGWCIVVFSKPISSSPPIQSIFKGGAWTHHTGATNLPDARSALAGTLRIGAYQAAGGDWLTGRLAAAAVWIGTAMNTTQIATLSAGSLSAWAAVAGGPTEHWEFNQASWATTVTGQKGVLNLAAAGTGTIVTGDDPASGVYTLAAGGTPATVTAVVADSAGSAPAAAISSGVTVTAVVADSVGSAPPANQIISMVIGAPAVVSLGSAPTASVGTGGTDATVTAVTALSRGSAPVAALATGSTVTAVVADSVGSAPAGTATQGVTVTAVPALSTGLALRPSISPAPAGGGVSGDVAATFAEAAS